MHLSKSLFSTRNLPIRNLSVLKCGATQVRNLFFYLDHGTPYLFPNKVHQINDTFMRASELGLTHQDVAQEQYAFVVMRDPTRRLLSLYFDKVIGRGELVRVREHLMQRSDVDLNTNTVSGHLKNCLALLDLLERILADRDLLPPNPHWFMQTRRLNVIKGCKLKVLLLENLDTHLDILLREIVPDVANILTQLNARNVSTKVVKPADMMTQTLIDRVGEVYPRDQRLYDRAVKAWSSVDMEVACANDVPRLFY
jgi:hypothetical protein